MVVEYVSYKPKSIVNVHKHVDGWFWDKYSAHPYVGCQHGCCFCYWRDEKYNRLARERPDLSDPFSQYIKVKENAPELLEKELSRLPRDVVLTGDYQPAEKRFGLSRRMLDVCLKLNFPVEVLERSPQVVRDLDVLKEINKKSWACVFFSITAPDPGGYKDVFEGQAPSLESRFEAMEKIANAGILTGAAFMPILPFILDSDENLKAVVKKTQEHGGSFVLAGGLTLSGAQKNFFFKTLGGFRQELVLKYENLYQGEYGPPPEYFGRLGLKVKELCEKYGISDRMPRYIPEGELGINKKVASALMNRTYYMELACDSYYRIWAYRKVAWAIDEMQENILEVRKTKGLKSIPGVGKTIEKVVEEELDNIGEVV